MRRRKLPSLLGLALKNLIEANGWTRYQLAARAGISDGQITTYVWTESLTRERLDELAGLMGLGPERVERAIMAARLVLPPPPLPWSPVNPTEEQLRVIETAVVVAATEVMDSLRKQRVREIWDENKRLGREKGRRLAAELKTYSEAERRALVAGGPDYQHWGLAVVLCAESEAAAAKDPQKALELAEFALFVAEHVQGTEGFQARLKGWCTGAVSNAQRVGSDLPLAEKKFGNARHLWEAGDDPAGLLSEAYFLDLEASLRRAQRRLPEALELHDNALKQARLEERGSILLNRACTLQDAGDYEEALRTLERASEFIDAERQPRLRFGLRFNQASTLCFLDRAREAALLLGEVRRLAERLRNDIDLVRCVWLEASCAAGVGDTKNAEAGLNQVRQEFEARALPFDYALASLDLSLVYRAQERSAEIVVLADQILRIFQAQKVHREAIASVILFQEAAQKKQVTAELIRRVQDCLRRAKSTPEINQGA